ncbi:type 3 dihydrofolate reductase [Cocleimonas sp. KMM 6892]|uniref:type 3 dihydrofolate reductase n=1 Tax=unclassified Cocleimonas TaxID=2639732 RepID=UPI002DBD6BE3|nr:MULTISPECIES: type 3 dihydrofolate reductase [unclassified Cocleimonas]MEB8433141.1 type 3 dihydrofolate reductase [Cocleimonas sp. KMM 6892]MEC4715878.1 type 3 dihydrofolate reductase [Cocleimonas sp. KMM 6895]MEC4745339.1 type 3 dihydrofolate reductase [Cocleimonas sp. KMM 6896]
MKLSMIVAMAHNRVIGLDNKMPWHLPADLQWFKKTTLGSPIIMGRKTYDSIGRPLPGRLNIILSRNTELEIEGCTVVNTLSDALDAAKGADEVFITGGAHLYEKFLQDADCLYLTMIDADLEGDTFFPDYTQYAWKEIDRIDNPADEKNPYPYSFVTLIRTED